VRRTGCSRAFLPNDRDGGRLVRGTQAAKSPAIAGLGKYRAWKCSFPLCQGSYPLCQSGHLSRGAICVNNALLRRTHQHGPCDIKSGSGRLSVSSGNRFFDFAKLGTHSTSAGAVHRCAVRDFSDGLLGRYGIGHGYPLNNAKAFRYRNAQDPYQIGWLRAYRRQSPFPSTHLNGGLVKDHQKARSISSARQRTV